MFRFRFRFGSLFGALRARQRSRCSCAPGLCTAGAQSSLVDAIKAGDTAGVRALLDTRADVNATQQDGTAPLHWAVDRDSPEIVQMLIRAGANVKAANRYGATPLWLASVNGNARTIAMLLEAGADASSANADGETSLMVASRTGKPDAVSALLARGADPNAKESWRGQTALMWAAAEGHATVIDMLVAKGADLRARSNAGFTALLFAAREGRIAAVEALLKAGADMNDSLPVRRRGPQAGGQTPAPPAPHRGRPQCVPARGRQRALRAGRVVARSRRRSERRAAGLHRAASGVLGAQGRHCRQQQPGAAGLGQHGQPDVRAKAGGERRTAQRARRRSDPAWA